MHKNKTEETAVDHLEFNEMFRRNEAIVYNFIRYRILDKSLAQDVLQETFYLAYKKWDILKDHPNQTGWLLETARHKIQEFNRKIKKLECETSLDDHDDHEYVAAKDEYGKAELDMVLKRNWTKKRKRVSRDILWQDIKYRKLQNWRIFPRTTCVSGSADCAAK